MSYRLRFTPQAEDDLLRLYDFLLEKNLPAADAALVSIRKAVEMLRDFPFACRKAQGGDGSPFLRELLIPFGGSGYVALFEIEDSATITLLAFRHQREEDYL